GERAERVRFAEALVATAVHELEELHRELHVANPSTAALDLYTLLAGCAHVLLEPNLGLADLLERVGIEFVREDERGDGVEEGAAEAGVAGQRPRLDQRLLLPGRGLLRVVLLHRGERARQRSAPAAGAERRVHPERDPLAGWLREQRADAMDVAVRAVLRC